MLNKAVLLILMFVMCSFESAYSKKAKVPGTYQMTLTEFNGFSAPIPGLQNPLNFAIQFQDDGSLVMIEPTFKDDSAVETDLELGQWEIVNRGPGVVYFEAIALAVFVDREGGVTLPTPNGKTCVPGNPLSDPNDPNSQALESMTCGEELKMVGKVYSDGSIEIKYNGTIFGANGELVPALSYIPGENYFSLSFAGQKASLEKLKEKTSNLSPPVPDPIID